MTVNFVRFARLLCLLLLSAVTLAQPATESAKLDVVAGELAASEPLIDPEFGIAVRALGLRRTVEMWQWQLLADAEPGAKRYQAIWSQQPIASVDFDPEHRNPAMPFMSAQWLSGSALLNGQPVSPALLQTLDGWQAQAAKIDLLPENLAAIFRVEDGQLFSGNVSEQPQIGDLRVSWQSLPSGPVRGLVLLNDAGLAMGEGGGLIRGMDVTTELPGLVQGARPGADLAWCLLAGLLLFLAFLLLVVLRRVRQQN